MIAIALRRAATEDRVARTAKTVRGNTRRPKVLSTARLDELIEEALVDAYGEDEQTGAFHCIIEEHLALPFTTAILGVTVVVKRVDLAVDGRIVAICSRAGHRQLVPVLDLPLPAQAPDGAEWIAVYRRWVGGTQR